MREEFGSIMDFKGFDWKNATDEDMVLFGKTVDFPEPGINRPECYALLKALHALPYRPAVFFETGICYGTTTRIFIAWTLKYGGSVYSCEIHPRPLFEERMREAGYWQYVNLIEKDTQLMHWDKIIHFLFIDSEHHIQDALGEYMKYRKWLIDGGIVGFHDVNNCLGVNATIDIVNLVDKLELVSESLGSVGIKFFKIMKKNQSSFKDRYLEWLERLETRKRKEGIKNEI